MLVTLRRRRIYRVSKWLLFLGCALFVGIIAQSILSDKLFDGFGCDSRHTPVWSRHRQQHAIADRHNVTTATLFPIDKPLVILSISYHESPIQDLIDLLEPLGVRFIQKGIDTWGCEYFNSCRSSGHYVKDLVLGRAFHWLMNGRWAAAFYSRYRNDPDWQLADAFLCFHPAATCELFVPFNKPIIIWTTIRVDNGRMFSWTRHQWLETLRTSISADHRSVVASNNRYDVEYTRYFTGIESTLLPSYCGYTHASYTPTRAGFLIYRPVRAEKFLNFFADGWTRASESLNIIVQLMNIHELYPNHELSDLVAHRGIVNLPVQPSMMSIFEQYRMNIPLFFPSQELLVEWQLKQDILSEINIYFHDGTSFRSLVSQNHVPHPYGNRLENAEHWLKLSDWYSLPHIFYYDSFEHLAKLLNEISDDQLRRTSERMNIFNQRFRVELVQKWKGVLKQVARNSIDS